MEKYMIVFVYLALATTVVWVLTYIMGQAIIQGSNVFSKYWYRHQFEFCKQVLLSNFHFYTLLNPAEQQRFAERTRFFIINKKFISSDGFEITDEARVLLAATLAQLTFGFDSYDIPGFKIFHLYPDAFYSRMLNAEVKGLTVGKTKVMLSWPHFLDGINVTNDKLNVGLHELAHSLWLNRIEAIQSLNEFKHYQVLALGELIRLRKSSDIEFLREYAAANLEEFWACSVECFFEAPVEFKNQLPELYTKMVEMLRQDTAQLATRSR